MHLRFTSFVSLDRAISWWPIVIVVGSLVLRQAAGEDIAPLQELEQVAAVRMAEIETEYQLVRNESWQARLNVSSQQADLKSARQAMVTAEKEFSKKKKESPQNQKAVQTAETHLAEKKQHFESVKLQLSQDEKTQLSAQNRLAEVEEQLASQTAAHTERLRLLQQALEENGQFVSFAKRIAPIFAQHCLACHNARAAEGEFDLNSYAALLRGGENGPVIEPGDAESSSLFLLIEAEEMPQESEPLTAQQQEWIRKWIDIGAPLDAGVDPEQSLFSLLPAPTHPQPPSVYAHPVAVTALAFHPTADLLAVSGYNEVLLYDSANGRFIKRFSGVAERTYALDFSPDGLTLAVASGIPSLLGEVKLFRVEDGAFVRQLVSSPGVVYSARFNHDGSLLAATGEDCVIRIVKPEDGKIRFRMTDHFATVMEIAWSSDGTQLASASIDQNSKVFDMATGLQIANFQKSKESNWGGRHFSTAFSPDEKQILSAGNDKLIRVWNIQNGELVRDIGQYDGDVLRMMITPDGTVYTTSADHSIRVHKFSDGKLQKTLTGHQDWVYSLALDPSTKILATGDHRGHVRLWNTDDGQEILSFLAAPGVESDKKTNP